MPALYQVVGGRAARPSIDTAARYSAGVSTPSGTPSRTPRDRATATSAAGSDAARRVILAEHTPNPDCVKLLVGDLGLETPADFGDAASAAEGSALAARLFALGGVGRVFLGADFVAVTKLPDVAWHPLAGRVVEQVRAHLASGEPHVLPGDRPAPEPTPSDLERVRRLVDEEIRPLVARDGGDVVFVDYRAGILSLQLRGACAGCPSAERTLREGIALRMRQVLRDFVDVVAV
jgi:Fe-S cluster biogenesis protein NfuA